MLFGAVLLWLLGGKHIKWRFVLPAVCVLIVGITAAGSFYHQQRYRVTYLTCGSGQAILVSDTDRHVTLIDCAGDGGYRDAAASVREWMRWNGCTRIDTLILTAVDRGHARDLPALLEQTEVDELLIPARLPGNQIQRRAACAGEGIRRAGGQRGADRIRRQCAAHGFPDHRRQSSAYRSRTMCLCCTVQRKAAGRVSGVPARSPAAPEVVLAENNLEDADLLAHALDAVQAERLVVQAAFPGHRG